jgi:hypothetical protein
MLHQYGDLRAPLPDEPEVISVTSSSAQTKLVGSSGSIPDGRSGRYYTWYADGGTVYAVFGNNPTADDTASSGATVPLVFPTGQLVTLALPDLSQQAGGAGTDLYVACKTATGTAKLRYWPTSGK